MQTLTLLMKKVTQKVIYNVQEQANQKNMFKSNTLDHENDDMLPQYGDIRDRPCSIKPEYYLTMHKLKSELHLSENQQQGAICTLVNNLFGRREYDEWK